MIYGLKIVWKIGKSKKRFSPSWLYSEIWAGDLAGFVSVTLIVLNKDMGQEEITFTMDKKFWPNKATVSACWEQ